MRLLLPALVILAGSALIRAGEPPVKAQDLAGFWEYMPQTGPPTAGDNRTFLNLTADGKGARGELWEGKVGNDMTLTYRLDGKKCIVRRESEPERVLEVLFLSRDKLIFYDRALEVPLIYVRR